MAEEIEPIKEVKPTNGKEKQINAVLIFPAELHCLELIRDYIGGFTTRAGYSNEDTYAIQFAVDEACSNVVKYSYKDGNPQTFPGRRWMDRIIKNPIIVSMSAKTYKHKCLIISVINKGTGFNSKTFDSGSLDERLNNDKQNGFGIPIIKEIMYVRYKEEAGVGNVLTMAYRGLKNIEKRLSPQ